MRRLALCIIMYALPMAHAAAQAVGDQVAGAALARSWCANCHVVGRDAGPSPASGDAAPTFASIAAMPSTTALSLRVFLQTPHRRMPDFSLSRTETDDVIAYILSLRRN
jgi:mono/diheme cytochrome c family protein